MALPHPKHHSGFEQLGLPDPALLAGRILAAPRLGPRMRAGLLLYLEGLSTREAARAVGYGSHMSLWRAAGRYGLHAVHDDRRELRKAVRKLAEAQRLMQRLRGGPSGTIRAFALSLEAREALECTSGI